MSGSESLREADENEHYGDWIGAAFCGGLATAPLVLGIVGWAIHWNAYTNLTMTLGGLVLWRVLIVAWRHRA